MALVLIVEDDRHTRLALADWAQGDGFDVEEAASLADARACLHRTVPDVILLDLDLPDGSGLELLEEREAAPLSEVVVVTAHGTVESAVAALKQGATDFLVKPVDRPRLKAVLAHATRTRAFVAEIEALRASLRELGRFGRLVGASPAMQSVYDLIARVAPTRATVLLTGESGTGKELAAHTIHATSKRRAGPFLPVNCGAIAPGLIETELFGHERGSFTGAERTRKGYFEQVSGGTLFLDEITEMSPALQVKLLRVLETGAFTRVGGTEPISADVRVIAATNRDPEEAAAQGRLREDLLYRLSVFPIEIPPLRDRGDDVRLLAEYFLELLNREEDTRKRLTNEAVQALRRRRWPGNVRELRNVIQRAFILADEDIGPESLGEPRTIEAPGESSRLAVRIGARLDDVERQVILATLRDCGDNRAKTAEVLGISQKTLYNRLKAYERGDRVERGDRTGPGRNYR